MWIRLIWSRVRTGLLRHPGIAQTEHILSSTLIPTLTVFAGVDRLQVRAGRQQRLLPADQLTRAHHNVHLLRPINTGPVDTAISLVEEVPNQDPDGPVRLDHTELVALAIFASVPVPARLYLPYSLQRCALPGPVRQLLQAGLRRYQVQE